MGEESSEIKKPSIFVVKTIQKFNPIFDTRKNQDSEKTCPQRNRR